MTYSFLNNMNYIIYKDGKELTKEEIDQLGEGDTFELIPGKSKQENEMELKQWVMDDLEYHETWEQTIPPSRFGIGTILKESRSNYLLKFETSKGTWQGMIPKLGIKK